VLINLALVVYENFLLTVESDFLFPPLIATRSNQLGSILSARFELIPSVKTKVTVQSSKQLYSIALFVTPVDVQFNFLSINLNTKRDLTKEKLAHN